MKKRSIIEKYSSPNKTETVIWWSQMSSAVVLHSWHNLLMSQKCIHQFASHFLPASQFLLFIKTKGNIKRIAMFNWQRLNSTSMQVQITNDFLHSVTTAMMVQESHTKNNVIYKFTMRNGEKGYLYDSGLTKQNIYT